MTPRFTPAWWLPHAHLQTIYGSLFGRQEAIAFRRERWTTPDADFVDVDFVDGPADAADDPDPGLMSFTSDGAAASQGAASQTTRRTRAAARQLWA